MIYMCQKNKVYEIKKYDDNEILWYDEYASLSYKKWKSFDQDKMTHNCTFQHAICLNWIVS